MVNTRPPATAGTTTPEAGRAGQSTTNTTTASWPVTTWQGWQHFATTAPPAPPQPGEAPRACGPLPARHGRTRPFTDVITDLENALDLQHHRPGTLPRHATYLHQRTAGRIGSLTRLLRQAAITAINDGTERITKKTLDAVQLDHLAEQHHRPHTRTRRPPAPP